MNMRLIWNKTQTPYSLHNYCSSERQGLFKKCRCTVGTPKDRKTKTTDLTRTRISGDAGELKREAGLSLGSYSQRQLRAAARESSLECWRKEKQPKWGQA
jgi:hypothetical protein